VNSLKIIIMSLFILFVNFMGTLLIKSIRDRFSTVLSIIMCMQWLNRRMMDWRRGEPTTCFQGHSRDLRKPSEKCGTSLTLAELYPNAEVSGVKLRNI